MAQTERQSWLYNGDMSQGNPFTEALKTETDKLSSFVGRGTPAQRKAARIAKRADRKEKRRQLRATRKLDRLDRKGARKAKRAGTTYTPLPRPTLTGPTVDIFQLPSLGETQFFTGGSHQPSMWKPGDLYLAGPGQTEMGWIGTLTQAPDSNKHAGSGHIDFTVEAYATQETRKENWDQPFMALTGHPSTPTLNPSYKQMYKEVETKGFANKIVKKYFT